MFSTPFSFLVGNVKQKKTFIGGAITFSILIVSIGYFSFLLNLYISNYIQAKVTIINNIENAFQSILITENFLIFEILINGMPLKQVEKQIGKTLLNSKIYYLIEENQNQKSQEFEPIECTDPSFVGLMCMKQSDIMNKDIFTKPKKELGYYALSILPCDPIKFDNCAIEKEVYDNIFSQSTQLVIYIKTQQYNPLTLKYENKYKQEFYGFDPGLYLFSQISLSKATTNVSKGLVFQSALVKDTIYDYKRIDKFKSLELKKIQKQTDYIWVAFQIDQIYSQIFVQHPVITEILAQFMGIFNCLLVIGVIGRKVADSQIRDDMNNMLLREYYKKTSAALIAKKEGIQLAKKNKFQIGVTAKSIIDLQAKINQIDFSSAKQQYFKMSYFHRLKRFIKHLFGMKTVKKGDKYTENESYDYIYQKLLNESSRGLNIFQLYKDIIQIKMALKLILTKEQFVALKFCGTEISQDLFNNDNLKTNDYKELKPVNKLSKIKDSSQEHNIISQQIPPSQENILRTQEQKTSVNKEEEQGNDYQKQDNSSNTEEQIVQSKDSQAKLIMRSSHYHQSSSLLKKILTPLPQNEGDLQIEVNSSTEEHMNKKKEKYQVSRENSSSQVSIDLLQEMDSIDQSEEKQAFFLERFLQNSLSKSGQEKSNPLNMKILANLLVNNFEETQDNNEGEGESVNNNISSEMRDIKCENNQMMTDIKQTENI